MMLKRIRGLFSRRAKKARPGAAPQDRTRSDVAVHRGPSVVHQPIPRSDLDPEAVKIVLRLTRFDHQAYLVGGCVRDLLLDRRPKDFDVGTSATPRQVRRLFRNCRIIGRRFRLAHIYFQDGKIIEVATFRGRNGSAADPAAGEAAEVLIVDDNQFGTAEEDALRRDFTINSLFYDINRETVLDHADGLGDLRRKLVRTIGDPRIRFREDPIRILRAIKFAARLGFAIERETLVGLESTRDEIPKAAPARVLEEIYRFCRGGAARRSFELLRETGVFEVILPELTEAYGEPSWDLLYAFLERIDQRLAAGEETTTSEILTVLILPAILEKLGWSWDGTASQPHGLDVRDAVDSVLRPLSLRLRCPRRDQEMCRLTAMTLFRMVPIQRLSRNGKRAILRRECLPVAVRLLEVVARRLGGEFEPAHELWSRSARPIEAEREQEPRPRRRRSRRGGRKRSGRTAREGAEQAATPTESTRQGRGGGRAASPKRETPRRSADDGDFFSKLPTAPSVSADDGPTDRYGAGSLSVPVEPGSSQRDDAAPVTVEASAEGTGRRRTRRRRGRGSKGGESAAAPAEEPVGDSGAAATESTTPRRRRRRRRRTTSPETSTESAE